jgi:nicotinamidase/pyrazinamidase
LIVVDVQNDLADPDGKSYVDGGERIIPEVNAEIAEATTAGALVVYAQDRHRKARRTSRKDGGTWPVYCMQGTWGAQLDPDLKEGEGSRREPEERMATLASR